MVWYVPEETVVDPFERCQPIAHMDVGESGSSSGGGGGGSKTALPVEGKCYREYTPPITMPTFYSLGEEFFRSTYFHYN